MHEQNKAQASEVCGILVVDKPLGWSSMDVVRHVRTAAGGVKTGHAGTLDPLATGVLVCCLGKATRWVEELMGQQKVYEAEMDLSAFTATDDREGAKELVEVKAIPDEGTVRTALAGMVGEVDQVPPAFSAVHVDGRRAYKMARKGQEVVIQARKVRIDGIELLGYGWPLVSVRITCGKGTYIRSIAHELGKKLGTGGHLAGLRRTRVGAYDLSMAVSEARLRLPIGQGDLVELRKEDRPERECRA